MKIVKYCNQVWTLNSEICMTHFISKTRQLFETIEGTFVYFLDEDKLYKLNPEKYFILLLKLVMFQENLEYNTYKR